MKSKITKLSTIYKIERTGNPVNFQKQRDEFLDVIMNSHPKMNVSLKLSVKPF
jgi:hypothetical protein